MSERVEQSGTSISYSLMYCDRFHVVASTMVQMQLLAANLLCATVSHSIGPCGIARFASSKEKNTLSHASGCLFGLGALHYDTPVGLCQVLLTRADWGTVGHARHTRGRTGTPVVGLARCSNISGRPWPRVVLLVSVCIQCHAPIEACFLVSEFCFVARLFGFRYRHPLGSVFYIKIGMAWSPE